MTEKYLKLLEFNKIVGIAAEYCACPEAADRLKKSKAYDSVDDMRRELACTDAVASLLIKTGNPRIQGVCDVMNVIRRAEKGGILSMSELLTVAATLRNFKYLLDWYGTGKETELAHAEELERVFYGLVENNQLYKNIYECILSEDEMADGASDALYDIRRKIRASESAIRDKLDSMIRSSSTQKYLQDAIVSQRS
ncbi:MAG: endonuclease MutS2, partial [Pygmaiobacter sp.]